MKTHNVPFYANFPDNTHCFQAAFKMVLKFFLPEKDFSWQELDVLTAKVEGLWTWPLAGLLWLNKNSFEVRDIEFFDYNEFTEKGGKYLVDFFGKEVGEAQIKYSELGQEVGFAKEFVEKIKPEVRIPTMDEIKSLLESGYLLICNINACALDGLEGFSGHFVVITGFDDHGLILHDPGLPAHENRNVPFDIFEKAWAYPNETAKNIMAMRLRSELPE